jgi:hypothetical protein
LKENYTASSILKYYSGAIPFYSGAVSFLLRNKQLTRFTFQVLVPAGFALQSGLRIIFLAPIVVEIIPKMRSIGILKRKAGRMFLLEENDSASIIKPTT